VIVRDATVYPSTFVGDFAKLDLSVLTKPYCEPVREVWEAVPYVSRQGTLGPEPPPKDDPCTSR